MAMTNTQKRAHDALARAEKALIHHYVWESDPDTIAAAEKRVARHTKAWRKACKASVKVVAR